MMRPVAWRRGRMWEPMVIALLMPTAAIAAGADDTGRGAGSSATSGAASPPAATASRPAAPRPRYGALCERHPEVKPCRDLRAVCEDPDAPNRYRVVAVCRRLTWQPPTGASSGASSRASSAAPSKRAVESASQGVGARSVSPSTLAKDKRASAPAVSRKPPAVRTTAATAGRTDRLAQPLPKREAASRWPVVAVADIARCREEPTTARCQEIMRMCIARKDYVWGVSFRVCEELAWLGVPDSVAHPIGRVASMGLGLTFNTDTDKFGAGRLYGLHNTARVVGHDWPWALTSHSSVAFGGSVVQFDTMLMVGAGVALSPQLRLGLVAGGALGGATDSRASFALSVPVEVFVQVFQGQTRNVTAYIRSHFNIGGPRPGGGPPSAPFADEIVAGMRAHFLRPSRPFRSYQYFGYAIGAEYREWIGTRFIQVNISWAYPSELLFRSWLQSWFGI